MSESELPRISRRTTLKWIAGASGSAALPAMDSFAAVPAGTGYGPDPDLIKSYQPGDLWPLTFSDGQRELVRVLCDIIMPEDETSPSASSLGVHDFIDEWISSPYPGQVADRKLILKGLKWLDDEAGKQKSKNFVSLSSTQQLEVCQILAIMAKKDRRKYPGTFFRRMRDLVAGGYYTTPEGMKDIGYRGNVAMPEWNGPPAEVLEKLGLEPEG
ncbi:MAG: gluconate 2-dehydrogenase subunit 3 family protein [Verrucomicrobiales bacterium]|nr:gluconate 2-dehydrogenase subunit 3 family protein [Verrucomicrobiales bacterium]